MHPIIESLYLLPKYWSFSFSICPSNEYSVLISFRMDWLDLLPILWPPDMKRSLENTLMLGKIEGKRRTGCQRTEWLDSIINH